MEAIYESLIRDLAGFIAAEDSEMSLISLLAMQEIRLFMNYSKETWTDEELRKLLRESILSLQDA